MSRGETGAGCTPAVEAAKLSAAEPGDASDSTQDAVDGLYDALNVHRRNCTVCQDERGQVNSIPCVVGESIEEAWALAEAFRDAFRKARSEAK